MILGKRVLSVAAFFILAHPVIALADEPVTVDNFVRAETDTYLQTYADLGAFGAFFHVREPTPLESQGVIRMNRDTIYSMGIFDLTEPVTVTKPETDRWQSMLLINQDHSILPAIYEPGTYTFTQEQIGTRYLAVVFRTLVDATDPDDILQANAVQDQITAQQADVGTFEVPDWDEESLGTVRDALNVLSATLSDTSVMFGEKDKLNPIHHLLGAAFGWGGNPKEDAIYVNVYPEQNDGSVNHRLHVEDIPVDGFVSITVYNRDGFMEPNDLGVNSLNNFTATPDPDGGTTVHFGGCDDGRVNCIPITDGWNYIVRLYQPRQAILDGSWSFPDPIPVE
jgi:hypothetical protein